MQEGIPIDSFTRDFVTKVITDDEFLRCVWVCCSRCLYSGQKIDKSIFEKIETREDYYSVMIEVAYENLLPFLKGLRSALTPILTRIEKIAGQNQE